METKTSEHEVFIIAVKNLRKPPYKGIHSVYSVFTRPSENISKRARWKSQQNFLKKERSLSGRLKAELHFTYLKTHPLDQKGLLIKAWNKSILIKPRKMAKIVWFI